MPSLAPLGKRKRPTEAPKSAPATKPAPGTKAAEPESDGDSDLQAIFKRAFEAKFAPLPFAPAADEGNHESAEEEDEDEDEWTGFDSESESESESVPAPVVVVHSTPSRALEIDKSELKAFLSSKPPTAAKPTPFPSSGPKPTPAEDEDSAANLKNDVALQRLLSESHLLSADRTSGALDPTGKNRHKALDLRLQALGAKGSLFKQEKMPMAHRKGIVRKGAERETKRRKEAKEAGIVLEVAQKAKGKSVGRRERAVDAPAVGRFRGGTLVLNSRDVASIEGPKFKSKGKGKRRR
ncbi:hypothetical protein EJ06DRAFT_504173 [Trichodelitschia bisporula]|uniref:Protein FAF1 n=1 Tax=Trichodelitschia bisporula TaxID=703511 RepID=A0A6G1I9E3_9PEZI|nr:hypothetical protein EJ06DRAFT_504173 [Trichodelitschia bisporula]